MTPASPDISAEPNADTPCPRTGRFERIAGSLPLGIGTRLGPVFAGEGLKARAMRGSAWTITGFGAQKVLRLGSNLILTRAIWPTALQQTIYWYQQNQAMSRLQTGGYRTRVSTK